MGGTWSQHGCDQRLRLALPKRRRRDGERDGGPRDSRWRPHRSDKDRVSTYGTLQGRYRRKHIQTQEEKLQEAPANRAQRSRKKRKLTTRKRYQQSNPAEIRIGPPRLFSPLAFPTHMLSSHPKTSQL